MLTRLALFLAVPALALAQNAAPSPLRFEVVSVRQNQSPPSARTHILDSSKDGKFTAVNLSLRGLLQYAFETPDTRIVGGPDALLSEKFDIEAKSDAAVDAELASGYRDAAAQKKRRMLQDLLAARFGLTVHRETRQLPVYELLVAKGGPILKASQNGGTKFDQNPAKIEDFGASAAFLAEQLGRALGHPVVDKTGLTGRYDLTLKWSPDDMAGNPDAPPSLFTAIQEQLGLRLNSAKGPVEVLVIDHITAPTEN